MKEQVDILNDEIDMLLTTRSVEELYKSFKTLDRKTNNGLFVNGTISASLGTVTWTGTLTDTANQGSSLLSTVAMLIFWRPYNFQHSSKAINLLFQWNFGNAYF